jgi:hypothetical protein
MLLKYIYTLFLGLLLATFIGVGISAFYHGPKAPEYQSVLEKPTPQSHEETTEERQSREEFQHKQKDHQAKFQVYSRNVSIIALGFAIVMVILSLLLAPKILIISDGILLGGVLTLLYSISWGFTTPDNKYRFLIVTIGLCFALILGYLKFIKAEKRT